MRRVLLVVLLSAAMACRNDGGSNLSNPVQPGPNGDPARGDWTNLAGEFANIGSSALLATFVSAGVPTQLTSSDGVPALRFVAPALSGPNFVVAGGATFFCCGGSTAKDVTVTTTFEPQPQQGWILSQRFADTTLRWNVGSGTNAKTLDLSTSGVTLTGSLASSGGAVVNGTQQLKLGGTVGYTLINGEKKTATLNVTLSYATYPTGNPTGDGQMGTSVVSGTITAPPANRCTKIPREGCPPCSAGPCGPAPCGIWPACPSS